MTKQKCEAIDMGGQNIGKRCKEDATEFRDNHHVCVHHYDILEWVIPEDVFPNSNKKFITRG